MGTIRENFVTNDARIKIQLEHEAVGHTVLRGEFFFSFIRIHIHGAELIHFEVFAVLPDALLLEEHGTRRLYFDDGPDKEHDEQGNDAAHNAAQDVHAALKKELEGGGIVGGSGDDVEAIHLLHKALAADPTQRNADMGRHSHLAALLDEASQRADGIYGFGRRRIGRIRDKVSKGVVYNFVGTGGESKVVGEVREGIRIDEDLIHPLTADVVSGVIQVGNNGERADGFTLSIAVEKNETDNIIALGLGGAIQHGLDICLVADEDHGFEVVLFEGFVQVTLPEDAGTIGDGNIHQHGEEHREAAVNAARLEGEEDEGDGGKGQQSLLHDLGELDIITTLADVVHGVEHDDDSHIDQCKQQAKDAIRHAEIRQGYSAVIDHITDDESELEAQGVEDDEVQVLFPAEDSALIHNGRPYN